MAGLTREVRVQAGTQSAFGTGVTPTVQLRGIEELAIRSKNEVTMLEDMTLGLAGASQAIVTGIGGEGAVITDPGQIFRFRAADVGGDQAGCTAQSQNELCGGRAYADDTFLCGS